MSADRLNIRGTNCRWRFNMYYGNDLAPYALDFNLWDADRLIEKCRKEHGRVRVVMRREPR